MADINTYALGLELDLQLGPVLKELSHINDAISNIHKGLKETAETANNDELVSGLQQEVDLRWNVSKLLNLMNDRHRELQATYDQGKFLTFANARALEEHNRMIEIAVERYNDARGAASAFFADHKKHREVLGDLVVKFDKNIDAVRELQREYQKSKKVLDIQRTALSQIGTSLENLEKEGLGPVIGIIRSAVGQFGILAGVLAYLGQGFKLIINLQNEYSRVNYQAIGGVERLTSVSLDLRRSLGATYEEGTKTLNALADAGFQLHHNLDELASANYKFSKATGVSQATTGIFQRRIVQLTSDEKQATLALAKMSAVIRDSGLSAQQAESMLRELSETVLDLSLMFDAAQVERYVEAMSHLSGAAQRAGVNADVLRTQFAKMSEDVLDNAVSWAYAGVNIGEALTDVGSATEKAIINLGPKFAEMQKKTGGISPILVKAMGYNVKFAASLAAMYKESERLGKSWPEFLKEQKEVANLNEDFEKSISTLTEQLKRVFLPLLTQAAEALKLMVPALTEIVKWFAYLIGKVSEFVAWIQKIPVLGSLFNATFVGVLVVAALKATGALSIFTSVLRGIKTVASGVMGALGKTSEHIMKVNEAAKTVDPGKAVGIRSFLTGLGEGLKSLGTPAAFKGVLVLGLLAVIVVGSLLLTAYAMNKLGLSITDIIGAASGLVIASVAFIIMAKAIAILGTVGMIAVKPLAILAVLFLAFGVAIALAGVGIMLITKGFTELFKVILANGPMFIKVLGVMAIVFPGLAIGMMLFGGAVAIAAPMILLGFVALAAAAALGLFINPVLERFGTALTIVTTALSGVGLTSGLALFNLAAGITAFMMALFGTAALGAAGGIASIFGVKDPLSQARSIADAIIAIANPANILAGALDKLGKITDVFGPFISSILGHKDELMQSVVILENMAARIQAIQKSIGEENIFAGIPTGTFTLRADPVRKPLITEDTARKLREERNQQLLVSGTKDVKGSLDKISDKISDNMGLSDLIKLLQTWLPKIAKGEDNGGLASAANQWI